MQKNNFAKKLAIGIASLALVCPLALSSVQANASQVNSQPKTEKISRRLLKQNKYATNKNKKMKKSSNLKNIKEHNPRINKKNNKEIYHKRANYKNNLNKKRNDIADNHRHSHGTGFNSLTKHERKANAKIDHAARQISWDKKQLNTPQAHYYESIKNAIKVDHQILNSKNARHFSHIRHNMEKHIKFIANAPSYDHLSKAGVAKYRAQIHKFYVNLPTRVNNIAGNKSKNYRKGVRLALENKFNNKLGHNKAFRAGFIRARYDLNKPIFYNGTGNRSKAYAKAWRVAKSNYKAILKNGMSTGSVASQIYNNIAQQEFQQLLK